MIQRVENFIIPRTKMLSKSNENNADLDNFRCRRMVEAFTREHLSEASTVTIIWQDKEGYVSSAYCNISPLNRLWILFVAWLQELFDFRIGQNAEK